MPATVTNNDATLYRTAGAAMIAITLIALVALSHHPAGRPASSAQDALAQMAAMQSSAAVVHGVMIAMFASLAAAHAVFASLLGATRSSVRLGMTAYGIACALLTVAMLCDGFVAPQLAYRFAGSTAVHADQAQSMLVAIGAVIQVFTKAGLLALGVAFPAFAYALATNHAKLPLARPLAVAGVLAGLLPAVWMIFGNVQLNPSNLPLLMGVQALWYLGVAGILFASSRTTHHAPHASVPGHSGSASDKRYKPVDAQS